MTSLYHHAQTSLDIMGDVQKTGGSAHSIYCIHVFTPHAVLLLKASEKVWLLQLPPLALHLHTCAPAMLCGWLSHLPIFDLDYRVKP